MLTFVSGMAIAEPDEEGMRYIYVWGVLLTQWCF